MEILGFVPHDDFPSVLHPCDTIISRRFPMLTEEELEQIINDQIDREKAVEE